MAQYFLCGNCLSLQTENPYWVADSYEKNLSIFDTGAIQRVLYNASLSTWIIRVLKITNVVDFGGGDGILTRFLRDQHINCYVYDKYAPNSYAQGFELKSLDDVEFVLAFEVLEHFVEPRKELDSIFKNRPQFVLVSTNIYNGEDSNWSYLTPDSGQHVLRLAEPDRKPLGRSVLSAGMGSDRCRQLRHVLLATRHHCRWLRQQPARTEQAFADSGGCLGAIGRGWR